METEAQVDFRGRLRSLSQTVNTDPSETVQSDGPRADIRNILREFGDFGGLKDNLDAAQEQYMDISEFTDYKDALGHAIDAEADFMTLPSKVREIFHHDVAEWLDTAHDKEKRDALVAAGYLKIVPKEQEDPPPTKTQEPQKGDEGGDATGGSETPPE